MEGKVEADAAESTEEKVDGAKEAKMASEEAPKVQKDTIFDKYERKKAEQYEKIEGKYPKLAKHISTFSEVWAETFPDPDKKMRKRRDQRREMAKLQREEQDRLKEMSPEEIEAMEALIPDWKKNALVTTEQLEEPEEKGIFGKMKSKLDDTDAAKKYYESEEYMKLKEARDNYKDFKTNLKDGMTHSQNPIVQVAGAGADLATAQSSCAKAILSMHQYDPDFDFNDLETEAGDIFSEFYCNFLSGNLEYLEEVSGGVALGKCKAEIEVRKKVGWKYKYEEVLDQGEAVFNSGEMVGSTPTFSYIVETQEIDCRVSTKNENEIIEGHDNQIKKNSWRITISRHDEPNMEMTGHYWEVTDIQKVGELVQLV